MAVSDIARYKHLKGKPYLDGRIPISPKTEQESVIYNDVAFQVSPPNRPIQRFNK